MVNIDEYTSGLNKTLRGKEDYFFLVNDTNSELKQHYDPNYKEHIDYDLFRKSQKSKEDYFKGLGVNYGFFLVADKSVILRDYLPFETEEPIRHVDNLTDCVYDTAFCLDKSDCQRNDTHLTSKSSIKLVSYFFSVIYGSPVEYYEELLKDKTHIEIERRKGDLFLEINWSAKYGDELFNKYAYKDVEVVKSNDTNILVDMEEIPEEFRRVSIRDSQYYINPNSISDKRAVIFHGSSAIDMIPVFNCYYREVFFYWNHSRFNKDLVDWFNPDDVLDIQRERFLDKPSYPILTDPKTLQFPTTLKINQCEVNDGILKLNFAIITLTNMVIPFKYEFFINDDLISEGSSDTNVIIDYPLGDKYQGYINVDIYAKEDESKTDYEFEKRTIKELYSPVSDMDAYFNSLNGMMIGKDLNFFIVNDKNNELKSHYDTSYKSNFNVNVFRQIAQSKQDYLNKLDIKHNLFSIPDKSVVLSDKLPFEFDEPIRNVDMDEIDDMYSIVDEDDYYSNDTGLNHKASLKVISHILSEITNNSISYEDCFKEHVSFEVKNIKGNLCSDAAWSYGKDFLYKHNAYIKQDCIVFDKFFEEVELNTIPEQFRKFNNRDAIYYRNDDSNSSRKLLIFYDSSLIDLLPLFTLEFREVLVYMTEGYFPKDIIEWYKPDNLIEFYREACFESMLYKLKKWRSE